MLITRAPHRVSFFGGGSDFLDHTQLKNSHSSVFGMAINKYSYVAATFPEMTVKDKFRISYSKTDNASSLKDLKHELAREVLSYFNFNRQIHISSMSDVPAESGLGTSSAFTVSLVTLISKKIKKNFSKKEIAKVAYEIERNIVGYVGGIQDHLWASFGGVGYINLKNKNYYVSKTNDKMKYQLNKNSFICYLGKSRNSSELQKKNIKKSREKVKNITNSRNNLAIQSDEFYKKSKNMSKREFSEYFEFELKKSWQLKKDQIIINKDIIKLLDKFQKDDLSFKLCGAGGTGFTYFYISSQKKLNRLKKYLLSKNLHLNSINYHDNGVEIIYNDE